MLCCLPYWTIASASGCSDFCSSAIAMSISLLFFVSKKRTFVTCGFPSVIVPVLSKIMVSTLHNNSSGSPPLIRMPWCAHLPVPTISAVGVASHSAQGHAITITAAKYKSAVSNDVRTIKYRTINVIVAKRTTIGTKYAEIVSTTP